MNNKETTFGQKLTKTHINTALGFHFHLVSATVTAKLNLPPVNGVFKCNSAFHWPLVANEINHLGRFSSDTGQLIHII